MVIGRVSGRALRQSSGYNRAVAPRCRITDSIIIAKRCPIMPGVRPTTVDDMLSFKSVTSPRISPDGELVAFVVGDSFKVATRFARSDIWSVPAGGGEARQLTFGPRSDNTPRWSPDGRSLAFLSDREQDGLRQLYLLPRGGGEAAQLTHVDGAMSPPKGQSPMEWSPDGRRVAFLMQDSDTEEDIRRKKDRDDALEFERNPRYIRVYTVDIETGEVECVSPGGLQVWEFCWSPDGGELAVVASDLPHEHAWYTCRLLAFPLGDGPVRTLHRARRMVGKPVWSPDSLHVAFLSSMWSDRGNTIGDIFVVPAGGGKARDISVDHRVSVNSLAWSTDSGRLLTTAHEGGGMGVAEIDVATCERRSLWHGDCVLAEITETFSMDDAGTMAMVREDSASPADVWVARRTADDLEWAQLTRLHPQAAEIEAARTESIHWKGADGWEIQGWLVRPVGAPPSRPGPMVTLVHGGPTLAHLNRYNPAYREAELLAAAGIAVFLPNPRGSTGWGLEFAESNIGDMGGKDWEDIQAGIDYCVERRIADPDRLGIAGNSYGGFMAAWAVTQTGRFRAALMRAGISDWRSFHGKTSISAWDSIYYADADPWDTDGVYRSFSPITHVKNVNTPTLIIHGEVDRDVPVDQAYLFHRALSELGVEVELVVYPREPHGFQERNHILDATHRTIKWFSERL
jgi:dipeptidyl aminopeptidase/acylaminoacyl peptidase